MAGGRAVACFMSQATGSVRGEFSYTNGLVATSPPKSFGTISLPSSLPAGTRPKITFKFDTESFTLPGEVGADEVHIKLPEELSKLTTFIKALTHSKVLKESVAGHKEDTDSVDLTAVEAAFHANGVCFRDAVARATAEMARRNGDLN